MKHFDVSYLELRCKALAEEISHSAHEASIREPTRPLWKLCDGARLTY